MLDDPSPTRSHSPALEPPNTTPGVREGRPDTPWATSCLTLHGDPWGEWQDTCTHCGEGGELIVCFACDLVAHDACADLDEDYHFARDENGEEWWVCTQCFD